MERTVNTKAGSWEGLGKSENRTPSEERTEGGRRGIREAEGSDPAGFPRPSA